VQRQLRYKQRLQIFASGFLMAIAKSLMSCTRMKRSPHLPEVYVYQVYKVFFIVVEEKVS
jgi:hypothetical protein